MGEDNANGFPLLLLLPPLSLLHQRQGAVGSVWVSVPATGQAQVSAQVTRFSSCAAHSTLAAACSRAGSPLSEKGLAGPWLWLNGGCRSGFLFPLLLLFVLI